MPSPWAYLNGDWVPAGEVHIALDDVGFLLGVTVTERVPTGVHLSRANAGYLAAKARRSAHTLHLPSAS